MRMWSWPRLASTLALVSPPPSAPHTNATPTRTKQEPKSNLLHGCATTYQKCHHQKVQSPSSNNFASPPPTHTAATNGLAFVARHLVQPFHHRSEWLNPFLQQGKTYSTCLFIDFVKRLKRMQGKAEKAVCANLQSAQFETSYRDLSQRIWQELGALQLDFSLTAVIFGGPILNTTEVLCRCSEQASRFSGCCPRFRAGLRKVQIQWNKSGLSTVNSVICTHKWAPNTLKIRRVFGKSVSFSFVVVW